MNGIEKIIGRITDETQSEINSIQRGAKEECDKIASDSDKQAQELYWKLFKAGTNDAVKHLDRLNGVAQLESKKHILAEKQRLISMTYSRAVDMIRGLPEDQYVLVLAKLASDSSVTGSEQLIFSPDDMKNVSDSVCKKANELLKAKGKTGALSVSHKTRDIPGGLILSDGAIELNCSLGVLVESYKQELTGEISQMLFD